MKKRKQDWIKIVLCTSLIYNYLFSEQLSDIDRYRDNISEYISIIPEYVDHKISNSNKIKNNSKIDISFLFDKEESKKEIFETNIKLNLKLPNIKEKLKIVLYESKNDKVNTKDKSGNGSISYNLISGFKQSLKAYLGADINNRIDIFVKLKYDIFFDINDIDTNIYHSLKYFKRKKLVSKSHISFYKELNEKFSIININQYTRELKLSTNTLSSSLSLKQILTQYDFLYYELSTSKIYENKILSSKYISYGLKYKHYIKKWINFTIKPEVIYYKENDYKATNKLSFNFNIQFSK